MDHNTLIQALQYRYGIGNCGYHTDKQAYWIYKKGFSVNSFLTYLIIWGVILLVIFVFGTAFLSISIGKSVNTGGGAMLSALFCTAPFAFIAAIVHTAAKGKMLYYLTQYEIDSEIKFYKDNKR